MHRPYHALLWEQARVTGVLLLALYGAATAVHLALRTYAWANVISFQDAESDSMMASGMALCLAVALCLVRLDMNRQVVFGFEPRLSRLPVSTLELTAIPYLIRCGGVALLAATLHGQHILFFDETLPASLLLLPVSGYALAQAVLWGRTGISGASLALPLAIAWLLSGFWWPGAPSPSFGERVAALLEMAATVPTTAVAIIVGFLYAYAGLSLSRRGERRGLPEVWDLWRGREEGAAEDRRHVSPLDAQLWYAWRYVGWTMPLGTLFGGLALQCIAVALLYQDGDSTVLAPLLTYGPYIALSMSCLFVCVRFLPMLALRTDPQLRFAHWFPVDDVLRAQTWFLTYARSLAYSLPIAFVLSSAGWVLGPHTGWDFLYQGYLVGHISSLELAAFFSRPLLWSMVAAWLILSLTTSLTAMVVSSIFFLYFILNVFEFPYYLPPIGAVMLIMAIGFFVYESWRARSRAAVPLWSIAAAAAAVPLIAIALWANTYLMERAALQLFLALALVLMSVIVGVPRESSRMRNH